MYEITNPHLIYEGPPSAASAMLARPRAPLFLIHDGGGTTFSYHCLDPVNRPLWAVQNVHLHAGGYWEGGIPEMARHYIGLISKAMPDGGEILLGGMYMLSYFPTYLPYHLSSTHSRWSLGGLLSLEMAYQIATAPRPKFKVLGMIFIDSVYPFPRRRGAGGGSWLGAGLPTDAKVLSHEESAAMKLPDKVNLNMTHARMMVQRWDMPRWDARRGLEIPPTILLRAKDFVTTSSKTFVDYARELRLLGWDEYQEENGHFIKQVVDVEGHHFSIFEFTNIPDVTRKIDEAADALDEPEF
ncbi:alpha/beta-hydrolase [Xylariaceae sp. FL0662B]|nr:alpha/beta-hydrolase [Xylariaceae sp. FL0662B]